MIPFSMLVSYLVLVCDLDLAPNTDQFVAYTQLSLDYYSRFITHSVKNFQFVRFKGVLRCLKFDRGGGGCKELKNQMPQENEITHFVIYFVSNVLYQGYRTHRLTVLLQKIYSLKPGLLESVQAFSRLHPAFNPACCPS